MTLADQMRKVAVPDVAATEIPPPPNSMSMCAGDFVEIYSAQPSEWDALLTCFFIDTAKNIFEYIDTIAKCLKPGGVWINLGPLLYHFEEMDEQSIELSMEEIFAVMDSHGLKRVQQKENVQCTYTCNSRSLMKMTYSCVFFTAIKADVAQEPPQS